MQLPYLITLARFTLGASGGIQAKPSWTTYNIPIRCDALPIKDDIFFLQAGIQNAAQLEFHFFYNQDIRVKDRVQFSDIDALAGMPNSWFQLDQVFRPRDILQYIRAFGHVSDAPGVG